MFVQLLTVAVLLWNFKLVRGNGEDSENFFLSLQDCVLQIEQNGAYNNPRYVEYGGLEGQVQIVVAISLVLANSQSCQVLKEMFQNLLHSLWELHQDLGNKITSFNTNACRMFWREPSKGKSSGGRARYITTKDHIKVLRNTGMQWTTIAQCLGVSPKTLYRKRLEYGFEDSFTDISDEELECNIRDVLCLTPFSGESYIWGALRGCGIFIQRWKIWQVLQAIDPVNRAIR